MTPSNYPAPGLMAKGDKSCGRCACSYSTTLTMFGTTGTFLACTRLKQVFGYEPTTGKEVAKHTSCARARAEGSSCGVEGIHWFSVV